ncbi:putative nonribosomal peptide synthase [Aspergillus clavatus NRRL 1]|uniref:Nonribosomal peptide synthase, putative n=1 Tax=Aspergillus clavatus (strain ATCC 1007 / CBS 513.65 / DSM 816 / NCTC 3887 / NRRL 1 / QM 1276 / 107) TaxID=344612 RepID=A1CM78_ASPCL|nr:nonribosomal peptide synthase, putative [Aspergillus clavatus NRRL 1]EAW08665.1 nonribosomal peptide synthase, putative [Aspergillus clavatus NRRL 1]
MADDTEQLREGWTCLFPRRSDDTKDESHRKTRMIDPLSVETGLRFCHHRGIDFTYFLAAAWAVILQRYAEVSGIQMGLQELSDTDLEHSTRIGSKSEMSLLRASLEESTTVAGLLCPEAWKMTAASAASYSEFNTGIAICKADSDSATNPISVSTDALEVCSIVLVFIKSLDGSTPRMVLAYDTEILSETHSQHLSSCLAQAMASVAQSSELPLAQIPLIDRNQLSQIIQWQRFLENPAPAQSMYEIIYQNSILQPEHTALDAWDGSLTYHQLIEHASALELRLRGLGVKPGMIVATCFSKSVWAVVAMLAINKAGAAFMPLDPSHPSSRLRKIVSRSGCSIALTSRGGFELLKGIVPCIMVVSESNTRKLPDYFTDALPTAALKPDAPAYCLFTSGSTGEPKGCIVDHAAFASIADHGRAIGMSFASRVLQFASYSFGVSLIEIWCTLSAGGTVCVPAEEDRTSRLSGVMNDMQVNWSIMTPTVIDSLTPESVPLLGTVLVAGEPLKAPQIDLWASNVNLYQGYGLTEWAGLFSISPRIHSRSDLSSIGSPIGGRCWLVDHQFPDQLAGIGLVAELAIEGPSLAQGYINEPEKTAASFLESTPWMLDLPEKGHRKKAIYKTGDLVYYDHQGNLRYVGRKDRQVKIRGHRVELKEIEAHIGRNAVVEAIQPVDDTGPLTLVAFMPFQSPRLSSPGVNNSTEDVLFTIGDGAFKDSADAIKKRLEALLPDYMVPSMFIPVKKLPLTISGKIARQKLRSSASKLRRAELLELTGLRKGVDGPSTSQEKTLHELVVDLLNLKREEVGMEHDFITLGGDSVTAMRLVGKARQKGLHLTVQDVLRMPVLRDLARQATSKTTEKPRPVTQLQPFCLLEPSSRDTLVALATKACRVPQEQIEDIYPCTPLQEGMIVLGAQQKGKYIARFVYQLEETVDLARLHLAWDQTVAANSILRTRIIRVEGKAMHQVVMNEKIELAPVADGLDGYLETAQAEPTPMTLGDALIKAVLIHAKDESSCRFLVLTIHHAICDRWSVKQLMDQLKAAYNGATLSPNSFTGFIRYIQDLDLTAAETYWRSQFDNLDAEVFPALPARDYRPSATESSTLRINCRHAAPIGFTMSTVIRLAWAIVIAHYANTPDVVFGATVTGRAAPVDGAESLTAPTIATVPLRVKLDLHMSIAKAFEMVQKQTSEMIPFEQVGLQRIRKCSPEAEAACRFQSHLVVQPSWGASKHEVFTQLEEGAATLGGFAAYALVLLCNLTEDSAVDVVSEFDPGVLDATMIKRLMHHFEHVLQYLLVHPEQNIDQIPTVGNFDVEQLRQWNGTLPSTENVCVHEVIRQRHIERPDATAICAWDGSFTYEELDLWSTRLSTFLMNRGIKPEVFVPIIFEKSRWVIVAMLGVMKAGGAFMMLDPSQPEQRLKTICQQIHSPLIIAHAETGSLAATLHPEVVEIDQKFTNSLSCSQESVSKAEVSPDTALYAVFTSGSTGTPKGVIIEHRSYCSGAMAHIQACRITSQSRMLQFASYAFDTSNMEILSTLMAGGCVCVPSEYARKNELAREAARLQITHAILTPSLARPLLSSSEKFAETIIVVGEPMSHSDVSEWAKQCRLMNGYGPSECSVNATLQPNSGCGLHSDPRNIGFPTGAVCWVTNPEDHNILRPIGAVGELLIEGPIVGCGYLNDPDRTKAAFVDAPSWLEIIRDKPTATRLYRTGDLVKYASDGSLQYIGRNDTQVKLRGQRIELGEIENHIRRCFRGAIDVVVEKVQPSAANDRPCLVTFISMEAATQGSHTESLDKFAKPTDGFRAMVATGHTELLSAVPEYMVPDIFIPLSSMPRTVSGKADRRRLRTKAETFSFAELSTFRSSQQEKRAPVSEGELAMQGVWSQVLNRPLDEVGTDDTFYQLGGDSISAMQVVALARSRELYTSVEDILRFKTIANIVSHCKQPSKVSIQTSDALDVPFGLSPIQQLFFEKQGRVAHHFNQEFLLRMSRRIDVVQLKQALIAIVTRHPMLRAVFVQQSNGKWQQMLRAIDDAVCRYVVHTVSGRNELDTVVANTRGSLNIETGPLFAADLVNIAEDKSQYLFLVAHHLAIDLVSWRIIFADLQKVLEGEPLPTNRSVSFQAWCSLQEDYCMEHLGPLQAIPKSLPDNYPMDPKSFWGLSGKANVFGDTVAEKFTVDRQVSQQLLGEANQAFNTRPADIFNTVALYSFTEVFKDRPAPLVFCEGHGREPWDPSIDLSETVGWFTTLWPVIVDMQKGNDLPQLLRLVKDARSQTPRNGWAYFASRYLHPDGRKAFGTSHSAEIIFNYTGEYRQFELADSLFLPDDHSIQGALNAAPDVERLALFDITVSVSHGCLQFHFIYNRHMLHQDAIQDWIQACKRNLNVACEVLSCLHPRPTLSDLPLMPISHDQLDTFIDTILPSIGLTWENVEDFYPCSPVQQGMLVAQAKNADNYLVQVTWKIESTSGTPLNIVHLEHAWAQVVKRHAVLRTILVDGISDNSYLDQVVLKTTSPQTLFDKRSQPVWKKGDLLYRMTFLETENDACLCQLEINHAIIDAASLDIMKQDLCLAYEEKLPAGQPPLYSAFLEYLQQQPSGAAKEYWTAYLDGIQPCHFPNIDFAGGRKPPQLRHLSRRLPNGSEIHGFCKERNVTIWNIVCLAWTLVLRSYTHSDQVCFGSVKSSRDLPIDNVEQIVGPIINMLPFCMSLNTKETVEQALHKIQQGYLESLRYQTFPLFEINQVAQVAQQSLFNTAITVQRGQIHNDKNEDGVRIQTVEKAEVTEYDIVLSVDYTDAGLDVQLRYKTSIMSESQAASVLATFEQATSGIVLNSNVTIEQIDIFSDHDRALVWTRNSSIPDAVEACIHEIIEKKCFEQPDAPAVCAWDGDFTFQEVHRLSSELGSHLAAKGVGPEVIVPLCFEKSRWTVVAMLGVLKAGGAFILLDPSHPYARLRALCDSVGGKVIVSSQENVDLSRQLCSDVVTVGTSHASWSDVPTTDTVLQNARPNNAAYVIFTSGSTGKPKGVVIEHRAFCTGAAAQVQSLCLDKSTRFAQFSSFAFDICVLEHFTTLMAGGCICVLSESQRRDNLGENLKALGANHALLVPSVARLLKPEKDNALSTLILGGECMSQTDVSTWADRVRLLNIYGPAECSVISTVQDSFTLESDPRNIGYPCGCVCWIVDAKDVNKLVPNGAIGELLIEGPIVARGYLNDPGRTAEAFVPPPVWFEGQRPSTSFYRTGDLVRYNADGSINFIGRRDMQVKLRGQRIELEEVEAHVRRSFEGAVEVVAEVVVPAGEGTRNNPLLVAFVWFQPTSPGEKIHRAEEAEASSVFVTPSESFYTRVTEAEAKLRQTVPTFLVPSLFVPISQLPRTGSDKVDRRYLRQALAAMSQDDLARFRAPTAFGSKKAPSSEAEHRLQSIWAKVLGLSPDTIGLHDNLFHLGGDSIDAMKVAALSRAAGLAVSVASIFAQPTLEALAKDAAAEGTENAARLEPYSLVTTEARNHLTANLTAQIAIVVSDGIVSDVLPATEVQRFFIDRETLHYYNFALQGRLDPERLRTACDAMMARYSILRTLFSEHDGDLFQIVLHRLKAPFAHHHTEDEPLPFAQQLWARDRSKFDILNGPAAFFILVSQKSGDNHVFSIRISHAQWDGVSFSALVKDLAAAYNQSALPPTSDFASYQYHRAAQTGDASFSFWRQYLQGGVMASPFQLRDPLELPAGEEFRTMWHVETIPLPQLAPGITMATLVKAACAFYIASITSHKDIVIGQTVNARSMPIDNIDVILGPCLNFIPFRVSFQPEWTIRDLLESVRAQYAQTVQHEFLELKDIVQHATDWPADTEFGVIVQHQNIQLSHDLGLHGIEAKYSLFPQFEPRGEVFVFTEPYEDRVEVQVCANSRILSPERGRLMAKGISETIEHFSRSLGALVSDFRV